MPREHRGEFGYGDVWTWTALCPDSKLIVSWLVGERTVEDGWKLMEDLKSRLRNRIQLTTDGHPSHSAAIGLTFKSDIDWAILEKQYAAPAGEERRYSPPVCTGIRVRVRKGDPDPERNSTSYVERQNLTMRIGMRRFTRLTNAFSKRIDNHIAAVAIHFMHYNFARPHKSLALPQESGPAIKRTPAMATGVADHAWKSAEIVGLLD